MNTNKKSIFEYFEEQRTKLKFIHEIDNRKKKIFNFLIKTFFN